MSRRSRSSGRRGLVLAFAASALLHALLLPVRFEIRLPADHPDLADAASPNSRIMRVRTITAVAAPETGREATVPPVAQEPPDPAPSAAAAESVFSPAAPGDPRRGLGERTMPRSSDPRLWTAIPAGPPAPTALERARIPMAEGMGLLNDSLAAVAATERENSDWTFTDEDGNRWGVSPRTIHLGSQALSLQYCSGPTCPDLFVPPPGRREEFDNRVRGFNEIRVQAARAAIEDVLRQRAAAIRLRRDTTTGGTL